MSQIPNTIKLKIGSDGVSKVKFHQNKNVLVVGTCEGRVRIYDCNSKDPIELFRKRWHRSISGIDISKSGSKIISSSNEGAIKEHDFETGKETWNNLTAHDDYITSIIYQTENLLISGDDTGLIKFWDTRQEDAICELNVCPTDPDDEDNGTLMTEYGNYLSSINDMLMDSNGRHLFVAMDDGTLVTVNSRKRTVELRSETMGYSAKSIVTLKNQTKVGVVTDEGVITFYNWNQFGNLSDRFPVLTKKDVDIEKMVKINENVVAIATNTGIIKSVSIMPNYVLADIGTHIFPRGSERFGDCMSLDINHDKSMVVSGCPNSNFVCFFSTGVALDEFNVELQDRMENKRKKSRTLKETRKKRKIEDNGGFFDGFCTTQENEDEEQDSGDNEEEIVESLEEEDKESEEEDL